MKLVVGLGNPGSQYAGTRHNVGFDVVDELATRLGWCRAGEFDRLAKSKFEGLAMEGVVEKATGGSEKMMFLKPLTFMNLSGRSTAAAMGFYQLTPGDVMVVLDDLALPCGKIRIRSEGSSGGHNGLKDIERALGTNQYPRLRVGIDPTPPVMKGSDYVLGKFTTEQRINLGPAIARACGAIITWADLGITTAMNQFN